MDFVWRDHFVFIDFFCVYFTFGFCFNLVCN